ncbi:hypothetical protein CAPTEDRAFT_204288 [Capitella teleta]|uniref:Uncharacterized protein n=1 Tax=Capitella teleta TaxID=283909 RepID=R7U944_CAPTE|nr:hypothetical protein CAPTEDRAFT_204288 [Capitella teleta]|eukprot:ELU02875.1 hypothetical protein CAPTEDRAFT_204288 [Capitella teleta]
MPSPPPLPPKTKVSPAAEEIGEEKVVLEENAEGEIIMRRKQAADNAYMCHRRRPQQRGGFLGSIVAGVGLRAAASAAASAAARTAAIAAAGAAARAGVRGITKVAAKQAAVRLIKAGGRAAKKAAIKQLKAAPKRIAEELAASAVDRGVDKAVEGISGARKKRNAHGQHGSGRRTYPAREAFTMGLHQRLK